ncbi:MAG: cupin domain-containing protein [Bacteroidia bacterium]|jgi:predicted cupin superfamily sugar epimerase
MDTLSEIHNWITNLNLQPHPEGGWYAEVFRDAREVKSLDSSGNEKIYSAGTGIYFLLDGSTFSAFHRIGAAEGWHFYAGTGITIYCIHPSGERETIVLGPNGPFQAWIPANTWFASKVTDANGYALCGCSVAPGFEFSEFELAKAINLIREFPQHAELIQSFCRQ